MRNYLYDNILSFASQPRRGPTGVMQDGQIDEDMRDGMSFGELRNREQEPWEYAQSGVKNALSSLGVDGRTAELISEDAGKIVYISPFQAAYDTGRLIGEANQDFSEGDVGSGILNSGIALAALTPAARLRASQLLGQFASTTPRRILNKTKTKGGYSVNLPSGDVPEDGLMMGMYANDDPRNKVLDKLTQNDIYDQTYTNYNALSQPDNYFGSWSNPDDGKFYLDVTKRFEPDEIRQATKYGERTGQIAGFNVETEKTFPVGNWNEFIQSPEFHARMDEMSQEGRKYLEQFPAKEWWPMQGTSLEEVYGSENLKPLAGFIATTAPNTKPENNLQTASEYMRRYMKGEPIIQPDYRVPDTAMSRNAGTQLGMETGRRANLQKSARGDLNALQRDKVREEANALMGDPDAAVLDRHWARLPEDPSRGIFTSTEEGVIDAGEDYAALKNEVMKAAQKAGRTTRDYSADVWTGIRERIKNTGELYGNKYQAGAIQGDSKSYSDIFNDLIERKAKHLKISVEEMKNRLKSGDAELLSTLIAIPFIGNIYRQMTSEQQPQS